MYKKLKFLLNKLNYFLLFVLSFSLFTNLSFAASVVATINGTPITDADITARVRLMNAQGNNYTDNRKRALNNMIDDSVKLAYAENFKISPEQSAIDAEFKRMNLSDMGGVARDVARNAIRAEMAWQMVIARTIMPTITVTDEEIATEIANMEREQGLPLEITFLRLINIPQNVADNLTKPKNCDDAIKIAESFGGAPQKITAPQYELSADIRTRMAGIETLTWSPVVDDSVILICKKNKMKEYKKLDDLIEQNAKWNKAMFAGDQQLKQLRRRAVVVILDDKYKL
ncbi:MAG: SurA N-terminal domain-containing protein [Rickettsiales bacterium]|jgi:hypothetical protein|nr:SurA N-terminal domain-containing protein [Rickettsiales bacterium]